jgi:hypothetical protein
MASSYRRGVMDPLLVASRLPLLGERAMRVAIARALSRGRLVVRTIIDDALIGFERLVVRESGVPVRTALLFAQRDRVARELRLFSESRLAARLSALRRTEIVALGRFAAPFDAVVRNGVGRRFGIFLRRLPRDGRRLELLRRMRATGQTSRTPVDGVLVYDFCGATVRLLDQAGSQCCNGYLRAG